MSENSGEQLVSKAKLPPRDAKGRFMRTSTTPVPQDESGMAKYDRYKQDAENIAREAIQPPRETVLKNRQQIKDAQRAELARKRQEQLAKTREAIAQASDSVPVPAQNDSKDLRELFEASPFADEKLSGEMVNGQFKAAKHEESPGAKLHRLNTEAAYAQGPRVVSQVVESHSVLPVEPVRSESVADASDSRLSRWIKKLGRKIA